jgi:hypothetical protein
VLTDDRPVANSGEPEPKPRPHRRAWQIAGVAVVLALLVGGIATYRWWVDWQARLEIDGGGVSYVDGHPTSGITHVGTFSSSQDTVRYDAHRRLQLDLILYSRRSVRVTRVSWDAPTAALVTPVDEEVTPMAGTGRDFVPFHAFDPHAGTGTYVRFIFRFTDCEDYQSGDTMGFDHVNVTYEALGRTRHEQVKLGSWLAVTSPPDRDCPARPPAR